MEKLPPKEDMEYSYALYPDLSMVKIFFHLLYYLSFAFALYVRTGTYHFFFLDYMKLSCICQGSLSLNNH